MFERIKWDGNALLPIESLFLIDIKSTMQNTQSVLINSIDDYHFQNNIKTLLKFKLIDCQSGKNEYDCKSSIHSMRKYMGGLSVDCRINIGNVPWPHPETNPAVPITSEKAEKIALLREGIASSLEKASVYCNLDQPVAECAAHLSPAVQMYKAMCAIMPITN